MDGREAGTLLQVSCGEMSSEGPLHGPTIRGGAAETLR